MSWDASQPTDTTKIRNLGVVIRPNWAAIEQGDLSLKPFAINLNNRTQLTVADDPTIIEDSYIIYSKEDSKGVAQLWGVDFQNNKTQLTTSDFQLEQNGFVLLPPSLSLQWGQGTLTGTTSTVEVTFPRPFGAIPFSIVNTLYGVTAVNGNPASDASRGFGVVGGTITTTGFTAQNFNSGMSNSTNFGWMAIGPQ